MIKEQPVEGWEELENQLDELIYSYDAYPGSRAIAKKIVEIITTERTKWVEAVKNEIRKVKPPVMGNPEMTLGIEDQVKLKVINSILNLPSLN